MTTADSPVQTTSQPSMATAKQPVGVGAAGWVGPVLALVLTTIGAILIREALISAGWVSWGSWAEPLGRQLAAGYSPTAWLVPIGVVLILLALLLLVIAFRPRPKKALALATDVGVFLTRRGLRNLVRRTADDVSGVTSVSVDASRKRVRLNIKATDPPTATEAVRSAVQAKLTSLQSPPRVQVYARREGGST